MCRPVSLRSTENSISTGPPMPLSPQLQEIGQDLGKGKNLVFEDRGEGQDLGAGNVGAVADPVLLGDVGADKTLDRKLLFRGIDIPPYDDGLPDQVQRLRNISDPQGVKIPLGIGQDVVHHRKLGHHRREPRGKPKGRLAILGDHSQAQPDARDPVVGCHVSHRIKVPGLGRPRDGRVEENPRVPLPASCWTITAMLSSWNCLEMLRAKVRGRSKKVEA